MDEENGWQRGIFRTMGDRIFHLKPGGQRFLFIEAAQGSAANGAFVLGMKKAPMSPAGSNGDVIALLQQMDEPAGRVRLPNSRVYGLAQLLLDSPECCGAGLETV